MTTRQRGNELGPVGRDVAAAIANLRRAYPVTLRGVADRVTARGRKITASGVQRVESGDRRVDVDDLVAFAAALGVTPAQILGRHAGAAGADGTTSSADLAVWRSQLAPIMEAVDKVVDNHPSLTNSHILDAVANHLVERRAVDAGAQVALDAVGLGIGLALDAGARTAAGLTRYMSLVVDAINAGATTGEQVREHVRRADADDETTAG